MRPARRLFLLALALLGGAALIGERWFVAPQRGQLDAARTELARLDASRHAARQRLAALSRQQQEEDRKLAAIRAELSEAEHAPAKLWAMRIRLLKHTPAKIRGTLMTLRALARPKFAKYLQEALRRFTDASGGELPADISQLAPLLTAPATPEMLARYEMIRTGKLGAEDEQLIQEKAGSDLVMRVAPNGAWGIVTGTALGAAPGDGDFDPYERAMAAIGIAVGSALDPEAKDAGSEMMQNLSRALHELTETFKPRLESAFGSDDAFGNELKAAASRFAAMHGADALKDFSQLLPHFENAARLDEVFRPAFARLQYLLEHEFQPPVAAGALQPYLEKLKLEDALRQMKLSFDGEHVTMSFSLTTADLK